MPPAKTADEWITRLQNDLSVSHFMHDKLSHNYAELPTQDQWADITAKLDAATKDGDAFMKFKETKNSRHTRSLDETSRLKIQLFSKLLNDDLTDTEALFRSIILKNKENGYSSSYFHRETLTKLLLLSEDPKNTIQWFEKNVASSKDSHSSYADSKKSAWEKALAENYTAEGIKLLKEAIKSASKSDRLELISKLARLANLLEKPELGEQAMQMFEKEIIKHYQTSDYVSTYSYRHALNYYIHQKQWEKLNTLCKKIITSIPAEKQSSTDDLYAYQLTALYHLKRFDDFENTLNEALKKYQNKPRSYFDILEVSPASGTPVGALYIDLLSAKGDPASKELAYKICTHLLARNQGKDAFYKRIITLDPVAAKEFIEGLRKYDPYEERPLIWQAEMALQAGEIDKANTLIEQAIALDPSDGDHGKYSRMFCYDVLSRICAAKGDNDKSKFLQEVVLSIRQGEVADDYLYAGLIKDATQRYKKALGHFNDAYCLQSRLAKTLMEAGKFDEAIPHFKKAFELMPVSFGPRESQCFGCERLFSDERVQNLAIPTLNAFLEKEPNNPRAPYLLGLVFLEMKKEAEAITAFEKAVELDPNYFNAATKLLRLLEKDPAKFKQAQALKKQLFEIAPYEDKVEYIPNPHLLKSYWKAAETFPASPIKLTPLNDLGLKLPTLHSKQFKEIPYQNGYTFTSSYYSDSEDALDGWSQREILIRNSFLKR